MKKLYSDVLKLLKLNYMKKLYIISPPPFFFFFSHKYNDYLFFPFMC